MECGLQEILWENIVFKLIVFFFYLQSNKANIILISFKFQNEEINT